METEQKREQQLEAYSVAFERALPDALIYIETDPEALFPLEPISLGID